MPAAYILPYSTCRVTQNLAKEKEEKILKFVQYSKLANYLFKKKYQKLSIFITNWLFVLKKIDL